jgi:hypothetical protein
MLNKYQKLKNTFNVINKLSAIATASTGVGGIAVSATIALLPVTVILESVTIIAGISGLISMSLYQCICQKIKKHQEIKMVAVNRLESINKIMAEDEKIDENEFDQISEIYESYCKNNIELQRRNST